MPATDIQRSSPPSSSRFSILSRRRDQFHSMEAPSHVLTNREAELESFQRHVADRFVDLSRADFDELLSITWIQKLLDTFLCCQEEFKAIVFNNKTSLNKPPMDRYISEYFERSVKALDLCNAIRDGIDQIRQWQNQLEIVLCALDNQRCIGEGQIRRARKALVDLAIGMMDEKQSALAHRNRSFGRNNTQKDSSKSISHFRSLSWSVSRTWSASKQLQAIVHNLTAPRSNEILSTDGLNVAVYTMNYVLFFVMWALVAAIPCQDRGLQTQFFAPKQFLWSDSILLLHDHILEESKKDRKNSCGLLKEIHEIEKCARHMNELTDMIHFPLSDENEVELKQRVFEISVLYEGLKNGLNPLEKQVREVFHRIVRIRTEGLDSVGK